MGSTLLAHSEVHHTTLFVVGTVWHGRFLEFIHRAKRKLNTHQTTPASQEVRTLKSENHWLNAREWQGFVKIFPIPLTTLDYTPSFTLISWLSGREFIIWKLCIRMYNRPGQSWADALCLCVLTLSGPYPVKSLDPPSPNAVPKAWFYLLQSGEKSVSASGLPKGIKSLPTPLENKGLNEEEDTLIKVVFPFPATSGKDREEGMTFSLGT